MKENELAHKKNESQELKELTELVIKFVDFAKQLKDDGKITYDQYHNLTKNKIDFLNNVAEEKQSYNVNSVQKNLFY